MASFETAIKLDSETPQGVIRLIDSHGFYRAYNHSAFLFHSCVKQHKVVRKFVKNINTSVVYLGFPADKLVDRLGGREHKKTEFGYDVTLRPNELPDEAGYEKWLAEVPAEPESKGDFSALPLTGVELKNEVCRLIRNYPLDRRTPLETMEFVGNLRKMLDEKEE